MIQLDITDNFTHSLDEIKERAGYMPTNQIAKIIMKGFEQTIRDQGNVSDALTEDGEYTHSIDWAPRKDEGDGHPLLYWTGQLYESFFYNLTRDTENIEIEFGNDMPYAKYLNSGTDKMPARPFFILRESDLEEIEELIKKHMGIEQ